ncbi:2-keto-4-pentenoate hydratase [Tianweitania sediminis]|uniref:Fumarylacetoacetate hydrolase family protein n=1 Tax=Tianweitania sediminis TaxID=1502156 RepID=A0A8J7QX94_9HYPH|nr:fumarylacetoacetate hydrolase family protein [Tianweitania sediminis]MBP0437360.1 fumarylacetoacetate hydrolase family protein [Tianweitania sediminis]
MQTHDQTAAWLLDQHSNKSDFIPFAQSHGIMDVDSAYAVQDAYVRKMQQSGLGAIRGWKIGLTSKRMQAMCGIDQPVAGAILASRVYPSNSQVSHARFGRLGLEFEICTRLGADLPPRNGPWSFAEVQAAVDGVAAAVELIDDRKADYTLLEVQALIADNSWNAGVILGNWTSPPADLNALEGVVTLNGAELDRGFGRDVLDGPLHVLHWLANHLRARKKGLFAGEIVMTGSLITTSFPEAGSHYCFELGDLSRVELQVGV